MATEKPNLSASEEHVSPVAEDVKVVPAAPESAAAPESSVTAEPSAEAAVASAAETETPAPAVEATPAARPRRARIRTVAEPVVSDSDEEVPEDSGKEGCFAGLHHLSLPEFVVSKERCQAILKEIDKMPESWRDIAILRLIEGRPTREVCEILHITEKACYSRVSRIRKYFEDLFKRDNWP